jgi:hypothetical protein
MDLIEPVLERAFAQGGINPPILKGEFNTEGGATGRAHLQGVIVTQMLPLVKYSAHAAKAIFLDTIGWAKSDIPPDILMVCKFCGGVKLHTWQGMVGYCNKEWKRVDFRHVVAMDVTENDREQGRRLYARYGRPMNEYITLTPLNLFDRLEVFATLYTGRDAPHDNFVDLMVEVINTDMYSISSQFVISFQGGGVTLSRVNALLRINTMRSTLPADVLRADICKVFIREEPPRAYPIDMAHRGSHPTYPQAAIDARFNFSRADVDRLAATARVDMRPGHLLDDVPDYTADVESPERDARLYTSQGMFLAEAQATSSYADSKSGNNPLTM